MPDGRKVILWGRGNDLFRRSDNSSTCMVGAKIDIMAHTGKTRSESDSRIVIKLPVLAGTVDLSFPAGTKTGTEISS